MLLQLVFSGTASQQKKATIPHIHIDNMLSLTQNDLGACDGFLRYNYLLQVFSMLFCTPKFLVLTVLRKIKLKNTGNFKILFFIVDFWIKVSINPEEI